MEAVPTADKTASGVAASLFKINVTTFNIMSTYIIIKHVANSHHRIRCTNKELECSTTKLKLSKYKN